MEFGDVIRRRRMVRNYDPQRPIERAALERIAATAQRAPSAGFSQGQRLVIVTQTDVRRAIARVCDEADYVAAGFDPWISRAPALIVPCVSEALYHARYRESDKIRPDGTEIDWPIPYWWIDVGATWTLLLLAAIDEGLAAGFLGVGRVDELQAVLGLPADLVPIGVVTVGHPLPDRRSRSLERGWLKPDEFVHWERW